MDQLVQHYQILIYSIDTDPQLVLLQTVCSEDKILFH